MAVYPQGIVFNQSQYNETGFDPDLYGYLNDNGRLIPYIGFLHEDPLAMAEKYRTEVVTWEKVLENPRMWGMTELQVKKIIGEEPVF
jgi:hypothetical protein